MSEHNTKQAAHAAGGKARLRKSPIDKPDTVVHLPDGKTMIL